MFFYLVGVSSVICWVYGKLAHFFPYYGSGQVCFNLRHVQMRNLTTNQMNWTNQKSLARLVSCAEASASAWQISCVASAPLPASCLPGFFSEPYSGWD